MARSMRVSKQLHELLYQTLQTEQGGVLIYQTAVTCAVNDDLREEWQEYLQQTKRHVQVVEGLLATLELDPRARTAGRKIVHHIGKALVDAMKMALATGDRHAAELVATECVCLAETKDHANWQLIGHVAKHSKGPEAKALLAAFEEVEQQEDHHLYHTQGWSRELWIDALGFPAVLPPPEEIKQVETAIGASRAEHARETLL